MKKLAAIYTISADCAGRARSATRVRAGSAMLLADRWAAEGCLGISLTDPKGAVRSRERFRPVLNLMLERSRL